ncbi:Rsd/AlgQ family anti-sigma factor [Erwinia tracheiphila]|uniref:Regulator of sigma D n=1 Tax=Erwinia tracheiphila TaxID=65700 RepID=A0A0M2KCZ1_9GAMM|nr:Rsd/AlgQ family anti-sigma factor [Erwinia tracheiphila]AXF77552.1 Rsd/AlgQ family anti-sigma factor [Erwinia tracheiphila]EOS94517.1 anti-RNA polymerase sigma 70 factor [Erwinia tracheiphila PSU-1]KKF36824.1 anti-RNA polymerase sigma 70 factor [Erwinia tracheiphila]UIA83761.1 Rsd/AlgQ family anti-sigma factor [Erwinia tracheiphila]UIA88164.1 Rsd/AlgQ family anti-sigma factor [Erwinia tracheiphila]
MLNQLNVLTARVGGCSDLVDFCLQSRKQLLVAYYQMVGIKPNKDSLTTLDQNALDTFCQTLVDYLSTGHFTIYERFIKEMEGSEQLAKAAIIYPSLRSNTEQIMQVYDSHFENAIDDDNYLAFQQALSEIGEALEARFSLEDKFINLALDRNALRLEDAANNAALVRPA